MNSVFTLKFIIQWMTKNICKPWLKKKITINNNNRRCRFSIYCICRSHTMIWNETITLLFLRCYLISSDRNQLIFISENFVQATETNTAAAIKNYDVENIHYYILSKDKIATDWVLPIHFLNIWFKLLLMRFYSAINKTYNFY